LEQLQVDTQY
jgi:hypothetical protein